ncbi:MAG TPA: S8 family serine peptidase [Solirubrobacteraceae bacterium]|nr:S8 family serine peptidase [Solirubrobacteraceae bacterium]
MDRQYYARDRAKTVEEIDSVVAIRVSRDDRGGLMAGEESYGSGAPVADMPDDSLEAFRNAGWLFVDPTPETARAVEASEPLDSAEDAGKLVRRADGRYGIVTRRLNVQLAPELSEEEAEQVLEERGLQPLTRLTFAPNLYEVDTSAHADALAASVELNDDPRFKLAEPSFVEHVPERLVPTDPRYAEQWQWPIVRAEQAWDSTRGAGIRIAVIDNGFNTGHEDLLPGIVGTSAFYRTNPNGTVSFVQGTNGMPNSNHGTFCAGMAGARQNNQRGGCGAAPESELALVACLGDQVGTQTTLARAVAYAADPSREVPGADPADGADILVSSLGPNGAAWDLTAVLELAIEFAAATGRGGRGLSIFWAASNGTNVDVLQDEVVSHADVIAVVRSNQNDVEDNAARGPEVELIAPGVNVVSTMGNGGYGPSTGTSFAAPCAAGCAALALATNPDLTRDELRAIMRDTADKIGGVAYDANGHHPDYGFGRVNAQAAVLAAQDSQQVVGADIALVRQTPGWGSIPVAASLGDGTWKVTNGPAPQFVTDWAHQPGVRLIGGDFNGNELGDVALVRQTPGWGSIPVAFSNGDGTWNITNGGAGQFITDWAHQPGVKVVSGDFNGNGLTDLALVRQTPGWGSIPIAFANGNGGWTITNGPAPQFITDWAHQPGVRLIAGDFNGNGLTDFALVRQTPGWGSIPIAFANGDGTWTITNGPAPQFITDWAHQPGVKLIAGDFNGNGLTDLALVRQTPGWGSIPIAFANGNGTWTITNGPAPQFITDWAHQPGVKLIAGDFNGNGLTDLALVRQTPGWGSIPIAFANGNGTWTITNGPAPQFITDWAHQPGVKLISGDFNGNGLTDVALVRQTPGWGSIPVAFAKGDGTWTITNGGAPQFIPDWAHQPGVRLVTGDFNGNGLTDVALVRQTPGWGSIPVAFAKGDGGWTITNGGAPQFIPDWAHQPGVKLLSGNFG